MASNSLSTETCKENFQHVAWFGGSFSPPTNMHVSVVIEIGKKLSKLTGPQGKSCVCIIPVSSAYDKASVRLPCVSPDERMALCVAFLEAVQENWIKEEITNIEFKLFDYEFVSPTPVTTIESLDILKQKIGCGSAKIYLAQGQDNIMDIFARKWNRSDDLLKYNFIMFPRAQPPSELKENNRESNNFVDQMDTALKIPVGGKTRYEPILDETRRKEIIDNVLIIGDDFNDNTSSSMVRDNIKNMEAVESLLDPKVFSVLRSLVEKRPDIYQRCDVTHTASGGQGSASPASRRKSRRNSKRKLRKTRKSNKY
jgi:nicotinic acid mononucleotide adenylyltransferase